ncbi:MAG: response regulator transcription factor [Chitinophagia bacterium]
MEQKVIIADDHSIVRMGLSSLIKQYQISVVDEVSNCSQLMQQLQREAYTHLILDIILPDGNSLEIIENINNLYPNLSILIHSMQPVEVYGKILKKYNIHSYLYKGVSENEIKYHVESFINSVALAMFKVLDIEVNPFTSLSVRELEVLHYLLNGHRTKEISTLLGLKMNTISTIKAAIFDKVKAESFTHLLQLAHVHQISY